MCHLSPDSGLASSVEDWDVHWTERTTNNAFEVDYFRQSHNPQKARVAWREKGSFFRA